MREMVSVQGSARRWWVLGAMALGLLAIGLDATVLAVALPTLATDLHASATDLQWIISSYTLALTVALLPGGLLGDRFGRKKVLLAALTLFGAGSLACAYAPGIGAFIAARTVLGLAAGALVPISLSVLTVMFSEEERPKAVGAWAAANFLALPAGPIVGGWLLSHYWWGWVFLLNLPVVAIGLIAVGTLMPESRASERPGMDPVGVLTSALGLGILVYGFVSAGQDGWTSARALAEIAAGLALLTCFAWWDLRLAARPGGQPLADLHLFRSASFLWGTVLAGLGIIALFGVLFAAPQYFQAILGVDAMGSGVRLLPTMAGLAAGAIAADRIAARAGAKVTTAAGFVLLAAGLGAGATMTVTSGTGFISAWSALSGLGFGLALATAASAAVGQLPADRASVGSALMQAVQKAGAPLAAAILGSVLSTGYQAGLSLAGLSPTAASLVRGGVFGGLKVAAATGSGRLAVMVRTAFTHGTDQMLLVSAVLAVAGAILAIAFMPRNAIARPAPGPGPELSTAGDSPATPGDETGRTTAESAHGHLA